MKRMANPRMDAEQINALRVFAKVVEDECLSGRTTCMALAEALGDALATGRTADLDRASAMFEKLGGDMRRRLAGMAQATALTLRPATCRPLHGVVVIQDSQPWAIPPEALAQSAKALRGAGTDGPITVDRILDRICALPPAQPAPRRAPVRRSRFGKMD